MYQCKICGHGLAHEHGFCLQLLGHEICSRCENVVVGLLPGGNQYENIKDKIKLLWL